MFKGLERFKIFKVVVWIFLICWFFLKIFCFKSNGVWGIKFGGGYKLMRSFINIYRTGIVLDIVGKFIEFRVFRLCFFLWIFLLNVSLFFVRWGFVYFVCFYDISVLGIFYSLVGLCFWVMNRLCGWWDK